MQYVLKNVLQQLVKLGVQRVDGAPRVGEGAVKVLALCSTKTRHFNSKSVKH
jgi:hypothetical protein